MQRAKLPRVRRFRDGKWKNDAAKGKTSVDGDRRTNDEANMQNDDKKTRDANVANNANKALGYKHEWIDTGGHSHRIIFDKKTLEKPKTTWTTLIVVAILAFLAGGVALLTDSDAPSGPTVPIDATYSIPNFVPKTTLSRLTAETPTALAAGWNDEFFLADRSGVALFNVDGKKLDFWKNESSDAPTALAFVADEASVKNGLLLIAYPRRIDAISFEIAPQETAKADPNANAHVVRTAARGALGPATTILSIPSAEISGVAASSERLFVADRRAERVWRYSWTTLDALKSAEKKETPPDCEIGAPEAVGGYPGLRPAIGRYFNVVYSQSNDEIVAANSGLFRVDAFDAVSGALVGEHSWAKMPGVDRAFGGAANPIAVVVSPNGWVATVETGKSSVDVGRKPAAQLFDLNGNWIAAIPAFAATTNKTDSDAIYIAAALAGDSSRILALKSNGDVEIFENR